MHCTIRQEYKQLHRKNINNTVRQSATIRTSNAQIVTVVCSSNDEKFVVVHGRTLTHQKFH